MKQQVPDIEFDCFVMGQIKDLFDTGKIFINSEYQRGDIWTLTQQIELIRSIESRYSVGVLVLYINDRGQYEILDGQQRLLSIKKYIEGSLELKGSGLLSYTDLSTKQKFLTDAYSIYYLKLKSHDSESKEEDVVQTFLRLQEGSPLNRAEKISAYRGSFKDTFKEARESHDLFKLMGKDKRFRYRLLAAEMLLLELEGDFKNKLFPSLELKSFITALAKYKNKDTINSYKLKSYKGNLDLLHSSLNYLLTGLKPREVLSFYLLVSYLRKRKADNSNLINEMSAFSREFLKNLYSFGIYDKKPPKGMGVTTFEKYKSYKLEAKVMTTPDSIKTRLDILLDEFSRIKPFIEKDFRRYHEEEEKRILYFRQKGLCPECGGTINFRESSADHVILHSKGGKTTDINNAQLLHERCHKRLEKQRKKAAK
ncbi:DUF262 domain-containing protein [Candidatus Kaiserbacteria bacterium]|nr:DUF262 domain-containing protein [Candidatus Kaiserbacteria bacterium]